ncbi:MAG TPA: protein-disulfide reductase DsbD domain-containing protein, partial [Acetobacteraceae bacterium]|nr:protein-disulfide reductase DsbD domain-containing protein [Acetobacteraceae bacterium]
MRHIGSAALELLLALVFHGSARAAASGWASNPHGAARLITAVEAAGAGQRVDVALQLRLTPGWHTYWRNPGDAGFAPTIDWSGSDNLARADIAWPAPHRLPSVDGLETIGYVDGVILPIAITLEHPGAPLHLHAEVDYASCKDICIPYHARLDVALPAGLALPGPDAPLIASARARVPEDPQSANLVLLGATVAPMQGGARLSVQLRSTGAALHAPDLFLEGLPHGSPGRPTVMLDDGGRAASLIVPIRDGAMTALVGATIHATVVDGARAAETDLSPVPGPVPHPNEPRSYLAIAGLALLGGLVLNLMPCILPVLSLKLLALVGYAGAERRAARLGLLATAAGVVVSFGVLAAILIALKEAGAAIGWGIQFQQPWFLAGMALVTTLFAASLWEWLPIVLPGRLAHAVGGARGRGRFSDAFLLGAFATMLAASCSAPFVGTAVGFALARGPWEIALVFVALGLGMATPFLAIAAVPRLVGWLPRPGPWMRWLQFVLGFALLGTAVWLLFALASETGLQPALLAGAALAVLLGVLAWLAHRASGRRFATLAAVTLAIVTVLAPALRGEAGPVAAPAADASTGLWRPFDEAAVHQMIAQGQVVFVDVTAAWCLTCKANELAVLDREPVAGRLRGPGVTTVRADWTRPSPAVTALLQHFGRYGVPLDVVYGPD